MLRHDNLDSSHAYQSGGKWIPQRIVLCESQSNNYCKHVFIIESLSLSTHVTLAFSVSRGITHPQKRVHIVTTIADAGRGPVRTAPQASQYNNKSSLLHCQLATWIFKTQARSNAFVDTSRALLISSDLLHTSFLAPCCLQSFCCSLDFPICHNI